MTTIAANKTSMVCDLQGTHPSGTKVIVKTKILELNDNLAEAFGVSRLLLGFSGSLREVGEAVQWYCTQESRPPRVRNLEVLMLNKEGLFVSTNSLTDFMTIKEKHMAIGSGMQFALAAMESGKSPKEAVKVSSKYDPYTGCGFKEYIL